MEGGEEVDLLGVYSFFEPVNLLVFGHLCVVLLGGGRVGLVVDIVRVKVLKHSKAKQIKDLWLVAKGKRLMDRRHFWICRINETVGFMMY